MPVKIVDAANEETEYEDGKWLYSYNVEASGVLTLLCAQEDLKWTILKEYSPSGWKEVSGTRHLRETDKREGTHGKAEFKAARMQVL